MEKSNLNEVIESVIIRNTETTLQHDRELILTVQELKPLVLKVDGFRDEYEQDRRERKNRFNVFNCLTRHHLEELHSNFICYLLNPYDTHDCGVLFLNEFCRQITSVDVKFEIDDKHLKELEDATVEREHYCGVIEGIRTFIDIYIECETFIIAIENKINAGEQPSQISRYAKYCKVQGKEFYILYLTKSGDDSSTAFNEPYTSISYSAQIKSWLESCLVLTQKYPIANTGIQFYYNLLNEKILRQPSNKVIMKMKEILTQPENIHLLKYMKEFTGALAEISIDQKRDFFVALAPKLDALKLDFRPVSRIFKPIPISKISETKDQGFTCFAQSLCLEINKDIKVYFCIEHNLSHLWYGLLAVDSKTNDVRDGRLMAELGTLKQTMSMKIPDIELDDEWWCCTQYFTYEGSEYGDDNFSYFLATEQSKAVEQFMSGITAYINVWKSIIVSYNSVSIKPVASN